MVKQSNQNSFSFHTENEDQNPDGEKSCDFWFFIVIPSNKIYLGFTRRKMTKTQVADTSNAAMVVTNSRIQTYW